jgi:hypothetical protein
VLLALLETLVLLVETVSMELMGIKELKEKQGKMALLDSRV